MKKPATKFMTNSDGDPVPVKNVQAYDRLRDRKVRAVYARWVKARKIVEGVMADSIKDLVELQGARKETGNDLGVKGNFSVSSFDNLINVQIKQTYRIQLDDRVRQARELMMDYAKGLAERVGGNDGHAPWQRAKALLTESIQPERGKAYIIVAVKPDRQHDAQTIRLDAADCWPTA